MEPGVKVEGLEELRSKLRRLDRDLPRALGPIYERIADPIARAAMLRAPKRTHRLAHSIRPQASREAAEVWAGTTAVTSKYAGIIHYGWPKRNIEPQPFLTDAIEATRAQTIRTYERDLGAFFDGIWNSYVPS